MSQPFTRNQKFILAAMLIVSVLLGIALAELNRRTWPFHRGGQEENFDDVIAMSRATARTTMQTMGTTLDRYWDHDTNIACYLKSNGEPIGCAYTPTQFVESAEREARSRSRTDLRWSREDYQ